ncbi:BZIP domain-containing protein [Mycena venus]|uniref:BZIP domain-containing protein n=1 Tax=Mycena venus TaxID=2733690 RepID=A0A8H6YML8_9AGAR|nr:BZIP domain-containing protein [Mycena venus]
MTGKRDPKPIYVAWMLATARKKPERSRNAKAQARHRAKRKAYIEELEETVTKLQSALGQFNFEHTLTVLPPPLAKIRELEQENARLLKQNDELHRLLAESGVGRRPLPGPFELGVGGRPTRNCDVVDEREYKRRKMDSNGDEAYISRPPSSHDAILSGGRPPPLTVPDAPLSHPVGVPGYHDGVPTHHTSTAYHALPPVSVDAGHGNSGNGPALHLPDSPPRSAYERDAHAQPYGDRDQPYSHSHNHERDAHDQLPSAHPTSAYSDRDSLPSSGHPDNAHTYTLPPFKFSAVAPLPEHDSWRPYAESERGP